MAAIDPRSHVTTEFPDPVPINLKRMLSRLEHNVLIEPSPELRKSPYTRARVRANVEHARTLLLNLEHSSSSSLPSKSKKSALQSDLQKKRELIKQLNQRLHELDQLDDLESEVSAESDDEEDSFPSYAPHRAADAGLDVHSTEGQGNEALQNAARGLSNELRRRGGAQDTETVATGNALFPTKARTTTSEAQTDAVLSDHRSEQESLETSLLDMAKQLKQQSLLFQRTLEGDKSVVDRALSGLDKNALGMEAAGQKMGTLRRMTEGKGWWDRMKLYGLIFGLWVFAFLIVFVGPKIRL